MNPPFVEHEGLYKTAIAQTKNDDDRKILEEIEDWVVLAGIDYEIHLRGEGAWAVKAHELTKREASLLKELYERRLANLKGVCRSIYTAIRTSASTCPYCEYGEVYEVDHFLPKDDFPELSVLPANLVPICHPCNHIKLSKRPYNNTNSLLHPYFDRLPRNVQWLFATMTLTWGGPVLTYHVQLDPAYGPIAGRLTWHFKQLELTRRFRERSSKVLLEIESDLDSLLGNLSTAEIAAHFQSIAKNKFNIHGNVVEAVAYAAAADSQSYCQGLYRN